MARKAARNRAAAIKTAAKTTTKKKTAAIERTKPLKIVVDCDDEKAFRLACSSAKLRKELELAVTLVVTEAVRKVFKQHKMPLTASQARKVAMLLFGD
jgi:hypothetical protein